jgi:uncharacterized membrane protein YphA (DoxX/SURF4 family)
MKTLSRLMQWGTAHHSDWFVVLRVLLGILLFSKGIDFISNIVQLQELLSQQKNVQLQASWLPFVIAGAHIFGGLFIVMGLFTRSFCLVQLPIVTAAIIMNLSNQFLQGYALIEIIAVFMLLLMFLLEGGGAISLDRHYYFRKGDDLMLSDN